MLTIKAVRRPTTSLVTTDRGTSQLTIGSPMTLGAPVQITSLGRVVLEDWSAEDAVDELIARIKQVAGS